MKLRTGELLAVLAISIFACSPLFINQAVALDNVSGYSEVEHWIFESYQFLYEGLQQGGDEVEARLIVLKLNEAVGLMDNIRNWSSEGFSDEVIDANFEEAFIKAQEARIEANEFLVRSRQRGFVNGLILWFSIPLVSFLFSVSVIWIHGWYMNHNDRRLLNMVIEIKEKK